MNVKESILLFGILTLFSLTFVSAWNFDSNEVSITTLTGNLTNFTQLGDTPASYSGEGNNCVLVNVGETALEFGSCGSGISWANAVNGTLYLSSNPFGFYNSTDFDINDYLLESNTTLIGNYSASTDFCIASGSCLSGISAGSEPLWNANYSTFLTHIDWTEATNGTLFLTSQWNATNTSYYLVTNPFSFYNSTNPQTETDPLWTGNQTNMLVDCSASNYAYGVYVNGTLKCRVDQTGAGGNPFDQVLNTTSNVTFNNLTVTQNISVSDLIVTSFFRTIANNFVWNIYDDGSDLILNVTSGNGDFIIEQDNTKLKLFNSPVDANNFKVFQVFSKEAGDVTEFTVTKAGVNLASYFIRSLAIAGNSTNNPTPFNCSTYASFIDCDTDGSGADFWVEDDIELQGTIYVGENISASGNITADFFFGNGSQLTDVSADEVLWNANYSTFLTHITWTNAVNGTLLLSANWNATNTSYYLTSNPFGFYNSTNPSPETFWNANSSTVARIGDCPVGQLVQNTTISGVECITPAGSGDITAVNPFGNLFITSNNTQSGDVYLTFNATLNNNTIGMYNTSLYDWVVAQGYTAGGISWTNAVNGTLLLSENWNATNTSYYLASNPFGFYNSTNPSPETFWNANYSTFLTHITWTNAVNGTLFTQALWDTNYSTNNDLWLTDNWNTSSEIWAVIDNSTFAPINEPFWTTNWTAYNTTWSSGISWTNAVNGTLLLSADWNATNTSYYLASNPFTFWNDTYATFNKTFADTLYVDVGGDSMTGNLNVTSGNVSITGRIILSIDPLNCANMVSGEVCRNSTGVFIQG